MDTNGVWHGDLVVTTGRQFQGEIKGDAIVKPGAFLHLLGRCCGSLTVENGGEAVLDGAVVGNAINRGGRLTVRGVIEGNLIRHSGETEIIEGAEVNGQTRYLFVTIKT